tara:strand:- start:432 stop:1730 length:1299 start_codon:yes stop_codon:yes gene_type:complete
MVRGHHRPIIYAKIMVKIPCRGGENITYTNKTEICGSCESTVTTLNLSEAPREVFCRLCTPWVSCSMQLPSTIAKVDIFYQDLLIQSYKRVTGIKIPRNDHDWHELLTKIFELSDKPDICSIIRDDYEYRLEVHPELRSVFQWTWDGIEWEKNKPIQDLSDIALVNNIVSCINRHLSDLRKLEPILRSCRENNRSGYWAEYHNACRELRMKSYTAGPVTLPGDVVYAAIKHTKNSKESVSKELIVQLFYDCLKSGGSYTPQEALNSILIPKRLLSSVPVSVLPTSPVVFKILSRLLYGDYGNEAQYLLLGAFMHWEGLYNSSDNFYLRDPIIWKKAFQLLRGISKSIGKYSFMVTSEGFEVRGETGVRYRVEAVHRDSPSAPWYVTRGENGTHVCIEILSKFADMPLGDQLSSLVMSLRNDNSLKDKIDTLY